MTAKKELYIERRDEGDYAIRRPGSKKASDTRPTQAEAIERAAEIEPDAALHVERVRTRLRALGTSGANLEWGRQESLWPIASGTPAARLDADGLTQQPCQSNSR